MANASPKIVLSPSQDIPFNKLILSQANVRRVKDGRLNRGAGGGHRPPHPPPKPQRCAVLDAHDQETGTYEIRRAGAASSARVAGQAKAPRQDCARSLRSARRRHRGGGFAGRERPACGAASAGPVSRLPGGARQRSRRGGNRRAVLRQPDRVKQRLRVAAVSEKLLEVTPKTA